jgi:DNA-binding transcriptional regulator YiaG
VDCTGNFSAGRYKTHRDNHAEQHNNFPQFTYHLSQKINLIIFNPRYPKNPKTIGERIRKARMELGLEIKELAKWLGVDPDTVINWEIRSIKPQKKNLEKLKEILFK